MKLGAPRVGVTCAICVATLAVGPLGPKKEPSQLPAVARTSSQAAASCALDAERERATNTVAAGIQS